MQTKVWRWILGLVYIVAVATIWISASYIVQSVVDSGVSPFLITYICNSLFVVLLPIVEIGRWLEDSAKTWFQRSHETHDLVVQSQFLRDSEVGLLGKKVPYSKEGSSVPIPNDLVEPLHGETEISSSTEAQVTDYLPGNRIDQVNEGISKQLDKKGRWPRLRVAKISLLVCPFWFLAQLTFNFSLKYTTVTSNTILSSVSSLFTFLVSVMFLNEMFTWIKLFSVLLCMAGTIIVSLGDKESGGDAVASNPLLGDILAIVSGGLYAVYISLIRKKIPDDSEEKGQASMAQFFGFLGLFNLLIFLPVALVLNFTKLEQFHMLSWKQFGLVIGKGLLDNVLSDYLWARAVLLTTATVATAGLTIQVPLAAVVDTVMGHAPNMMDYLGAISIILGFVGITIPSNSSLTSKTDQIVLGNDNNNEETLNFVS